MPEEITVKTILNKTRRRDPWFLDEYTINPYSGCSFNCLYCYIRGSKYGVHMEEKLGIKANALELLDKQLAGRARRGQQGFIVMSSATDPYLHFEKEKRITRGALELILKYRFPVHIVTKSDLILRDLDLLKQIDREAILPEDLRLQLKGGTLISFSFSTISDETAAIFEPGATPPSLRLQTLETILGEGFHAGVSLMPLLPYITDTGEHLEDMFGAFKRLGVKYILPAGLTLFGSGRSDSRELVFRAIAKHYPHLSDKYERLFGQSSSLPKYYSKAFGEKARELCADYGLKYLIV